MAIHKGDCITCGMRNVDIFDNDECLTCFRLDKIEKAIRKIVEWHNNVSQVAKEIKEDLKKL